MKKPKETFATLMDTFAYKHDLRPIFDDFLTMSLCAATPIPGAGKSHYEDVYLQTIAKYAKDDLRHLFPKLFARLIIEMEERVNDTMGNDVLGEYYELNFCRKNSGQFFTPMHVCHFMAHSICGGMGEMEETKRILDPTCGSGRMLLAGAKSIGKQHEFYGIDLDHTCACMTALNLFLNGIFHSEVMCADALFPDNFRISYKLSFLPLGIFRIENREQSKLWRMYKNTFQSKQVIPKEDLLAKMKDSGQTGTGSQLHLF